MNEIKNFNSAVKYISNKYRDMFLSLDDEFKINTYEIRFRSDRPVSFIGAYGTKFLSADGNICKCPDNPLKFSYEDIKDTFNRICAYSVYAFQKCINRGYIPMENGNRAGVCGTAVCEKDNIISVKDITSINVRISKEIKGLADELLMSANPEQESFIIAGPPSSGKTTLIRDIARQISSGKNEKYIKTAIIDERREISGISNGIITNDVGFSSDVLDSYPKSDAIDIAVRTLSPEVIICDEVATDYEIAAIRNGVNCGVNFIVSVHVAGEEDIYIRKQIRELLMTYSFKKLFLLGTGENIGKIIKEYNSEEIINEIRHRYGNASDNFAAWHKQR